MDVQAFQLTILFVSEETDDAAYIFWQFEGGQFAAAAETAAINSSDVLAEFYRSQVLHVEERGSFQLSHRCGKNDFSDCVIAGKCQGGNGFDAFFHRVFFRVG